MRLMCVLGLLSACLFAALPLQAQTTGHDSVTETVLPAWESRASTLFPAYDIQAPSPRTFLGDDARPSGTPEIHVPHEIDRDRDHFTISQRCASGDIDADSCRFHWKPALAQQ